MARVRITKTPKALSGLEVKMKDMKSGLYGTNGNRQFSLPNQVQSSRFSEPGVNVRNTLQPVDRGDANLEAEKGETAVIDVDGMPAHFKIGGKRHSEGGTPLSLPDNSFIYSDTSKMKIKDLVIQAQFGMVPKKSGYTPAEISKKYDINKFRKVLADKNSEPVERKTAEMMISNYNLKLAKLALIQESMKGFPQGIPLVAMPYIIENEMDASQFLPDQAQEQLEGAAQPDADTGEARYGANVVSQWDTHRYGGIPKAQGGYTVTNKGSDMSDIVNYLRERKATEAKEKLYKKDYNKAYASELKKWEENKAKEKAETLKLAAEKRSDYVQENELKRRESVVRQLTDELKSGTHDKSATEIKLDKALSDYQTYKNKYFPTTITYNTPKQEKSSSKAYNMDKEEKEYMFGKLAEEQPSSIKEVPPKEVSVTTAPTSVKDIEIIKKPASKKPVVENTGKIVINGETYEID